MGYDEDNLWRWEAAKYVVVCEIEVDCIVDCMGGILICFFFQAEDGIRDAQESRGLGDVYKRQLDYKGIFCQDHQILHGSRP